MNATNQTVTEDLDKCLEYNNFHIFWPGNEFFEKLMYTFENWKKDMRVFIFLMIAVKGCTIKLKEC